MFRYALENWEPDPYVAYVLHTDDLTAEQQNLIDALRVSDPDGTPSANLIVETIDLNADPDDFITSLREQAAEQDLPCVVVQTPPKRGQPETVFSGALTAASVAQLTDSPLRREIRDRLLKGDSVVWVYLESGRTQEDDEKFSLLTQELSRLQGELELPEIEEADLADLAASPESLKIGFSAVRLSRTDEQETVLRDMLLRVEHDLLDEAYVDKSMAFPVFGRGRALYALVGDGLSPQLIEEACRFLTGACQCTVKAENPGVDLLMQVDWDNWIQPTEAVDAALPPLAGFSGFGPAAGEDSGSAAQDAVQPDGPEQSLASGVSQPDSGDEAEIAVTDAGDDTAVPAADASSGIDVKSPASSTLWLNVVFVLVFAGCVVIAATAVVTRRTGA